MAGEGIECRVLYRDALMILIDKPAGMAVHRGPKGGARPLRGSAARGEVIE